MRNEAIKCYENNICNSFRTVLLFGVIFTLKLRIWLIFFPGQLNSIGDCSSSSRYGMINLVSLKNLFVQYFHERARWLTWEGKMWFSRPANQPISVRHLSQPYVINKINKWQILLIAFQLHNDIIHCLHNLFETQVSLFRSKIVSGNRVSQVRISMF